MSLDSKYCDGCGQEIKVGLLGLGSMKFHNMKVGEEIKTFCETCARERVATQRKKLKSN